MHFPSYSVIIAASGHEPILASTLDTILAAGDDTEIIVGCSEEATQALSIAAKFASAKLGRIRLATHSDIPAIAADLNAGLACCRGELVLLCADPGLLATTDYRAATSVMRASDAAWATWSPQAQRSPDCLTAIYNRAASTTLLLARRDYIDALGALDDALSWYSLWDYQLRCASRGAGVLLESERHLHRSGLSQNSDAQLNEGIRVLRRWRETSRTDPVKAVDALALELGIEQGARLVLAQQTAYLPWNEPPTDMPGARLTFLIALPRSGSTLLQRMLANHPDMHSLPEPWIMLPLASALGSASIETNYEMPLAREAIDSFIANIGGDEETLYRAIRMTSDALYRRAMDKSGKSLFLDKTPRYYRIVPALAKLYPAARFIILTRHPGAILSSMLKTWCDDNPQVLRSNIVYRDLTEGPALLANAKQMLGSRAVTVSYEQLVQDPEPMMRLLCAHLGLPWTNQVLSYDAQCWPANSFGDEQHIAQHDTVVTDYQQQWREHLSATPAIGEFAQACLDSIGDETLHALGYSKEIREAGVEAGFTATSADALTAEGERLYAGGRLDDAARAFSEALAVDPSFVTAHNNLGVLSWQRGDGESAVHSFACALDNDASNVTALVNLLEILNVGGRIEEAIPRLDTYLERHPDASEFVDLRADILRQRAPQSTVAGQE